MYKQQRINGVQPPESKGDGGSLSFENSRSHHLSEIKNLHYFLKIPSDAFGTPFT
ncbi:MAG: hypothetical protein AAFZ15_31380 [Bacteroidota bacterium]